MSSNSVFQRIAVIVASTFIALVVVEAMAGVILFRELPHLRLPQRAIWRLRRINMDWTRSIVQFEPACTQFDKELFYVLRPGECRFRNLEFDTTLRINSGGFRDAEAALKSPDVVVLGDSFAMGWGVDASETFSSLLGQRTGLKVLNTGVSSYGTVREKIGLSRVALDRLKYLVIQYCPNDKDENLLFYLRGNINRTLTESQYDTVRRWYRDSRTYYPGRNVDLLLPHRLFASLFGRGNDIDVMFEDSWTAADRQLQKEKPHVTEEEAFVNALISAGQPLPASLRKIVVFSLDVYSSADQKMIDGLEAMKASHMLDQIRAEVVILRVPKYIDSSQYYLIDGHLKPGGHAVLADVLASQIQAP
jgi:hypothetical protein